MNQLNNEFIQFIPQLDPGSMCMCFDTCLATHLKWPETRLKRENIARNAVIFTYYFKE